MRVSTTLFLRTGQEPYAQQLRQEAVEIDSEALDSAISWWFTGGDVVLDRITIDGVEYTGPGWPKGTDTCVKEGSEVCAYRTALGESSESDD